MGKVFAYFAYFAYFRNIENPEKYERDENRYWFSLISFISPIFGIQEKDEKQNFLYKLS